MYFSVIVPCHNSGKTIGRLLGALTRQDFDDFEVLLVDDASDEPYEDAITPYEGLLGIVRLNTATEVHCPGNTRQTGLDNASGEWVMFIDHDDFLEDGALKRIHDFIEESGEPYCVAARARSWNAEQDRYTEFNSIQAWLHGKAYNRENLIEKYNVGFMPDLTTHEDIYFNSCVCAVLYELERDVTVIDFDAYRWVEEPTSITRRTPEDRGYLYEHMGEFIFAASEPFFDGAAKGNMPCMNQIMMCLLHSYFYCMGAITKISVAMMSDALVDIREFVRRVQGVLCVDKNYIIDYIYSDPVKYELVRADCLLHEQVIVERYSFREFILRLS